MGQLSPGEALSRLKQLIINGKEGLDYTYIPSEKNRLLLEAYYVDKKSILLSLEERECVKHEFSDDPDHPDDYVYVFIKKGVSVLPRFYKELKYVLIDIYIKFLFYNENSGVALILSFHEAGDY